MFVERRPLASLVILLALILGLWLLLSAWPAPLEAAVGRKRVFMNALFNGITLGGLYFLVASGFTLIFGLMRNVNLAHGSLYLFGGYIGYTIATATGSWLLSFVVAFVAMALVGVVLQVVVFRRMEGEELRQTLVTIGISIVLADVMRWWFGGEIYSFDPPRAIYGSLPLLIVPKYPTYRLFVLGVAIVLGVVMWWLLNRTRIGVMIRAGVDDRGMLAAAGVNVQGVFAITFAIGAGMAGLAGVIGGSALSISPGEDTRYLLASLVVVIVGGMGSITGAALGALLIGLAEQFGLAYAPTYSVVFTFLIMVAVLAFRPTGILGRRTA